MGGRDRKRRANRKTRISMEISFHESSLLILLLWTEKKSGKLKLFVLPFEWTSWAEFCCIFSGGGGTEKHGAFWTRFRDAVLKLFGSSCLLFSSLSVSKVFWWLWNTNFHMIRRPIGESFHYELFRKLERCSNFKAASFGEVYFPWKVSETAVNPAPLVVSLGECNFIWKFSESGES